MHIESFGMERPGAFKNETYKCIYIASKKSHINAKMSLMTYTSVFYNCIYVSFYISHIHAKNATARCTSH